MSWFKVDDKLHESPKIRAAGTAGIGLWLMAGVKCASRNTDGFVDEWTARDAAYVAGVIDRWEETVATLVSVGLWHDARTLRRCDRCREAVGDRKLESGHFYFHDWAEYQLTSTSQASDDAKWKEARRRRLMRAKQLRDQIRDRDGTLCRYCGKRVDFDDHRSADGGTYDHLDPDGENTLANLVVACRSCNTMKGNRTPEEADMPLLEPGTARRELVAVDPVPIQPVSSPVTGNFQSPTETGLSPDRVGTETTPNPDSVSRDAHARLRTGLGRTETGFGPGLETGLETGRVRVGSGEAGDGPGPGHGPGPASAITESEASA